QDALNAQQSARQTELAYHMATTEANWQTHLPAAADLALIQYDFEYDLNIGNDSIHGGTGNDLLIGDYGTLFHPIATRTPQDQKSADDLHQKIDLLLGDLRRDLPSFEG